MKDEHIYGTAKVGEKGQVVIPIKARESLGIKPGDDFIFFSHGKMLHLIKAQELGSFLDKLTQKTADIKKMIENNLKN
jgi:AbrB family looped-hinge helix DNA binding protein